MVLWQFEQRNPSFQKPGDENIFSLAATVKISI